MEWLYLIITILSLISAIVAWIAKIKWSKEYRESKEAQIDLLKEKVEYYKDLSSKSLLDYLKTSMKEYEEINKTLSDQLEEAKLQLPDEEYSEEKDKIIRTELYQRTLNSLAVINGLIEIELLDSNDKTVKSKLGYLSRKIISIVITHDLLLQENRINKVPFDLFIEEVNKKIFNSIEVVNNITEDIYTNDCIPLALLLSELSDVIYNLDIKAIKLKTVKYDKDIHVSIHYNKIDQYKLEVLNKELDQYQLIDILISQLLAELNVDESMIGLKFRLTPKEIVASNEPN